MTITRTGTLAAAVALTAATTVAVTPAYAAPASTQGETGVVQYADTPGSSASGSLEGEFAQAGLVLVAGLAVAGLLAREGHEVTRSNSRRSRACPSDVLAYVQPDVRTTTRPPHTSCGGLG